MEEDIAPVPTLGIGSEGASDSFEYSYSTNISSTDVSVEISTTQYRRLFFEHPKSKHLAEGNWAYGSSNLPIHSSYNIDAA